MPTCSLGVHNCLKSILADDKMVTVIAAVEKNHRINNNMTVTDIKQV